jgi:hypothetical protein
METKCFLKHVLCSRPVNMVNVSCANFHSQYSDRTPYIMYANQRSWGFWLHWGRCMNWWFNGFRVICTIARAAPKKSSLVPRCLWSKQTPGHNQSKHVGTGLFLFFDLDYYSCLKWRTPKHHVIMACNSLVRGLVAWARTACCRLISRRNHNSSDALHDQWNKLWKTFALKYLYYYTVPPHTISFQYNFR